MSRFSDAFTSFSSPSTCREALSANEFSLFVEDSSFILILMLHTAIGKAYMGSIYKRELDIIFF
jgi:hypothetical protein